MITKQKINFTDVDNVVGAAHKMQDAGKQDKADEIIIDMCEELLKELKKEIN